jgi:hypothetical protein
MSRNDFRDVHAMAAFECEQPLHRLQISAHTIAFGTGDFRTPCSSDRDAGSEIANGKADAAKATTKPAIEIEKTQMQPCRDGNGNAGRQGNAVVQALAPEIASFRVFQMEIRDYTASSRLGWQSRRVMN